MPPSLRRAAVVVGALLMACAAGRGATRDSEPGEVFVDVLPSGAELTVDGVDVGPGSRTVPVVDPSHVYVFRATAPGFAPAESRQRGALLAGTRVALVLTPPGYRARRGLDVDDGESLAFAADALARAGRERAALEYAERAVDAAPRSPLTHRVLADTAAALGQPERAAAQYEAYLRLAPDAIDRDEIEQRITLLTNDERAVPGVQVGRGPAEGGGRR